MVDCYSAFILITFWQAFMNRLYITSSRLIVPRKKTAVRINSAANSPISANSVLMVLDVSMMTSVVEKKFANLELVKLNQVGIQIRVSTVHNNCNYYNV